MRFAKVVFLVAGVYGLAVLLPQYFLEEKVGRDYPPAITHPELYYGFIGVGVAWQVLFLFLASNPARYRPMMIPSIIEKATYGVAVIALFLQHRVSSLILGFAVIDLILGLLFVVAYAKTASNEDTAT
jgi:hypothetical protein